jgi:DNA-binding protein YbaB
MLMGMFDKFSQMKDQMGEMNEMRQIQKKMAKQRIEVEKSGVKIVMDGTQQIKQVDISDELLSTDKKKDLEQAIIDAMEEGKNKVQQAMMNEMSG